MRTGLPPGCPHLSTDSRVACTTPHPQQRLSHPSTHRALKRRSRPSRHHESGCFHARAIQQARHGVDAARHRAAAPPHAASRLRVCGGTLDGQASRHQAGWFHVKHVGLPVAFEPLAAPLRYVLMRDRTMRSTSTHESKHAFSRPTRGTRTIYVPCRLRPSHQQDVAQGRRVSRETVP